MYGDTRIPDHLMRRLTELPRLSVDHYLGNWMDWKLLEKGHPAIREVARITGGIGLFGLWHNQAHGRPCLERAVGICADLNDASRIWRNEKTTAVGGPQVGEPVRNKLVHCPTWGLAVVYQPFNWKWPKGTPPTHTGEHLEAELSLHRTSMETWRGWLAETNAALNSDVRVKYLVADVEPKGWFFKDDDDEWNDAMVARYNDVHRLAMEVFPGSTYVMYGNLFQDAQDRYDGREDYDVGCTSLYAPLDGDYHEAMLDFADGLSRERHLKGFATWLALASGCVDGNDFNHNVEYPRKVSWDIGKSIAGRVKAGDVIGAGFYSGPFDERTPGWVEQFIAYVWGYLGEPM